jgi:hypothetical protein
MMMMAHLTRYLVYDMYNPEIAFFSQHWQQIFLLPVGCLQPHMHVELGGSTPEQMGEACSRPLTPI